MTHENWPRPGWVYATLGDIRDDRSTTVDPAKAKAETFELYSIPAFQLGQAELLQGRNIGSTKKSLEAGTVILSKINPRINRVWVVGEYHRHRQIGSSEWIPFFPVFGVEPAFLAYYMRQDAFRNYLASNVSGVGGSLMRVKPSVVDPFPLVLAPRLEQRRIVAAIDSFFSRIDDAEATLARIKRNLERYRASVLKAAVEGRLVPTEAELARAEGRDFEPASVLLERILVERRRRWEEAELTKMKEKGKVPNDDRWKARYSAPVSPNSARLPELPEGWCWATVEQIGEVSGGLTQNPKRNQLPLQLPFLRVANVYANELRLDEVNTIGLLESELDRVLLKTGDLLVVEGNGSIDQIGRVAVWQGQISPCVHQNHLIKVRFPLQQLSGWSLCWLLAPGGRSEIQQVASSTSGLHTLSLSKVGALPIPLPPLAEQERIAREVERLISSSAAAENEVSKIRQRLARLRQSILKWAFEGRLVDQDPTDEPASVLLERIHKEREQMRREAPAKSRNRSRKSR